MKFYPLSVDSVLETLECKRKEETINQQINITSQDLEMKMVQNHESTVTRARPNSRRWQQKNYGSAKNVLQLHHPLTQSTLGWSVINKDKEWTDGWMDRAGFKCNF